jgi:hypothetical protein
MPVPQVAGVTIEEQEQPGEEPDQAGAAPDASDDEDGSVLVTDEEDEGEDDDEGPDWGDEGPAVLPGPPAPAPDDELQVGGGGTLKPSTACR